MQCATYECCTSTSGRQFLTKEEKKEMLEDYKEWLTKEAQGVDEAIKSLNKAG